MKCWASLSTQVESTHSIYHRITEQINTVLCAHVVHPDTIIIAYLCWTGLVLNLLILSPHRDDAAFSLTISIAHWLAVGHRVTVLNIFTRSLYAPYSDADTVHDNDRLTYVSAMRKKEDESFTRCLPGLAMVDLNLKDAPIRLRCETDIVCDMDSDPNDTALPKIRKAISSQMDSVHSTHALVIPIALGRHVDHRVVRDAALSFSDKLPTAFYEDLPYAARTDVREDLTRFREDASTRLRQQLHPSLVYSTLDHSAAFKLKTATLYASQIDEELADTIARFSHRYQDSNNQGDEQRGGERLWVNDLWLAQASANNLSVIQPDKEATPLP